MELNLKPLGDRVIVKPDPAEERTEAGLFIAKDAQEKPQRGTVVAVMQSCTASTAAPRSRWAMRITCCSAPTTSTASSPSNFPD